MSKLVEFGLVSEATKGNAYSSVQLDAPGTKLVDSQGLPCRSAPEQIADQIQVRDEA